MTETHEEGVHSRGMVAPVSRASSLAGVQASQNTDPNRGLRNLSGSIHPLPGTLASVKVDGGLRRLKGGLTVSDSVLLMR